jgi:hemerythrin-like metal-binding protein
MNNSTLFGRMQLQHLSMNNLIQFGDHLSVEHPAIDAQHKTIFNLGTKVYEGWRNGGSIDILRPAVDKLANLMHSHFAFEEKVLAEIDYEDLKNHAAEHRSMLDELSIMHDKFRNIKAGEETRAGSLLAPGWPIMQFVLGFTIGHVMSSDMAYCQTLMASRDRAQKVA